MPKSNIVPIDPIANLWLIARAWLADAVRAFGAPEAVARVFSRFARAGLARRLRALETLAMKLLLVEVSRLEPPRVAACARARTSPVQVRKESVEPAPKADPDRPETWRVRFELRIPEDDSAAERRSAPAHAIAPRIARIAPDPARERAKSEKLARRFEAVRRVFANPLPRARRLRRKLLSLGRRAYETAMRIALRHPPHNELDQTLHSRVQFVACSAVALIFAAPDSS